MSPVVYDVLIRNQIEAPSEAIAVKRIAESLHTSSAVPSGIYIAAEVIRDDNFFYGKDESSRHFNGFAVFTSEQKHQLIATISKALDFAASGDREPGRQLLDKLQEQFDYMGNTTLKGIELEG